MLCTHLIELNLGDISTRNTKEPQPNTANIILSLFLKVSQTNQLINWFYRKIHAIGNLEKMR